MRFSFWENGLTEVKCGWKENRKGNSVSLAEHRDPECIWLYREELFMLLLNQIILAEMSRGTTASHFPVLRRSRKEKQTEKVSWEQSLKVSRANIRLDFTLQEKEAEGSQARFIYLLLFQLIFIQKISRYLKCTL